MTNRSDNKQSQILFEEDETQTEIIQSFGDEQFINDRFKHLTEDVGVESDARSVISTEFDHFLFADAISQPIDVTALKSPDGRFVFGDSYGGGGHVTDVAHPSQFSTVTGVGEPPVDDFDDQVPSTQLIEFNDETSCSVDVNREVSARVTLHDASSLKAPLAATNVRSDTTEIDRVSFEEEQTDSIDFGGFQEELTRPYEFPPYARQTTPCAPLKSVSRERPEELYATDELHLASLRNEVLVTPRDDLAELETQERSRGVGNCGDGVRNHRLKTTPSLQGHNHEEILPVVTSADLGITRKKGVDDSDDFDDTSDKRLDIFFDFDFIGEESPVDQPSSVGVQRIAHSNLDDDEFYLLKITLPFKITIAQEDLPKGMALSSLSKKQKDDVFPLPKKQHSPNILERRTFLLNRVPKKSTVFYWPGVVIAFLALAVIILLLIVIKLR